VPLALAFGLDMGRDTMSLLPRFCPKTLKRNRGVCLVDVELGLIIFFALTQNV